MEIFTTGNKYPKEWVGSFTNMHKFAHLAGDFVYIEVRPNLKALETLKGKKIVYMDMEEPNRFFVANPAFRRDEYEWYFDTILTMCPFTAKWLNERQGKDRRVSVFYPIDPELGPPKMEKIYDIIYSGGLHSKVIFDDVKTISQFNYKFIAHNGVLSYKLLPNHRVIRKLRYLFPHLKILERGARYITEQNIPHLEKWKIMAQTKITLVHNTVPCNASDIKNVWQAKGWEDNDAFALFPRPGALNTIVNFFDHIRGNTFTAPQLKSRAFEAALCHSLILCRRDPWNIIERFFEPDKEFVYYEPGKLAEKVRDILSHWSDYEPIIENAHKKFMAEYTTQRFFEKYLKSII